MQNMSLTSKVALITGAARRVGAEIARSLHEAGMNVALHYNTSKDEAFALCEQFNQARAGSAVALQMCLGAPDSEKTLIKQAAGQWGRLDVLVNNASRFYRTPMGEVTEPAWDDLMASNIKSPLFLTQAAAPWLATQQGCVVNITDYHAEHPMRDYSVYCISKSALVMMTKALAKELGPAVRVNAVSPGAVMWPEGENDLTAEVKAKIVTRTSLARPGSASDIARTVLFLVRDAGYITGEIIHVDGGRGLR